MNAGMIRSGSLDYFITIGNKEYHLLYHVVGGIALTIDDKSIVFPIAHIGELAKWLSEIADKMPAELERVHRFEQGEEKS